MSELSKLKLEIARLEYKKATYDPLKTDKREIRNAYYAQLKLDTTETSRAIFRLLTNCDLPWSEEDEDDCEANFLEWLVKQPKENWKGYRFLLNQLNYSEKELAELLNEK